MAEPHDLRADALHDAEVSICQADLGLAERPEPQLALMFFFGVSICQADLGLAELNAALTVIEYISAFQSARQIWVWPNINVLGAGAAAQAVSICQADLGLAEPSLYKLLNEPGKLFQSARQIWVWPNMAGRVDTLRNRLFQSARQIWVWPNHWLLPQTKSWPWSSFNLPGRFGFGRTQ